MLTTREKSGIEISLDLEVSAVVIGSSCIKSVGKLTDWELLVSAAVNYVHLR